VQGFSLHANTQVPAHRRDQWERLIRYTTRGAVSLERLQHDANGDLVYTFTHPMVGRDHGDSTLTNGTLGHLKRAVDPPPSAPARVRQPVFAWSSA
jgi:hypothetical protein